MKTKTELLKISDLTFDQVNEMYYPRLSIDWDTVGKYKLAMDAGETFPNPKIGRLRNVSKNIVIDGRHTIEAMKKRNVNYVTCEIYYYDSEKELFADAVRFNAKHGRALTHEDEEIIIERLKEYNFTVDEIQKIIHVPAAEIKKVTTFEETYTVTGPAGQKRVIQVKPKQEAPPIDMNAGAPMFAIPNSTRNESLMKAIEFKNIMRRVINFLEKERLPDDLESRELIKRARGLMIVEVD